MGKILACALIALTLSGCGMTGCILKEASGIARCTVGT